MIDLCTWSHSDLDAEYIDFVVAIVNDLNAIHSMKSLQLNWLVCVALRNGHLIRSAPNLVRMDNYLNVAMMCKYLSTLPLLDWKTPMLMAKRTKLRWMLWVFVVIVVLVGEVAVPRYSLLHNHFVIMDMMASMVSNFD